MNLMNFLKAALMCLVLSLAIASCDDSNEPSNSSLKCSPSKVELVVGKEATVAVSGGTAPYTAAVSDATIASATVKSATITVKALKAGTATLTVTDKNKKTAAVAITVKEK